MFIMFIRDGANCMKLLKAFTIPAATKALNSTNIRSLHKRSADYKVMRNLGAPRVLYKSDNFLCIDKTFDVKINSNDPEEKTVEHQLRMLHPELVDPKCKHGFRFVHRLDMATTGILTLGLNKKASKHLAEQFRIRKVVKYYLALVRGHVTDEAMFISVPTGDLVDPIWPGRRCVYSDPRCTNPQTTTTLLVVLDRGLYDGEPATKVFLKPFTGKQHQLRVHCDFIGHTVVGDYTYSNRTDTKPPRMMLHSQRLVTSMKIEELNISAPDPFVARETSSMDSMGRTIGCKDDASACTKNSSIDNCCSEDRLDVETNEDFVHCKAVSDKQDQSGVTEAPGSSGEDCNKHDNNSVTQSSTGAEPMSSSENDLFKPSENESCLHSSDTLIIKPEIDIPNTYAKTSSCEASADNNVAQTLHSDTGSVSAARWVYDSDEMAVFRETAEKWKPMEVCRTYEQAVKLAEDFHPAKVADNIKRVSVDSVSNSTFAIPGNTVAHKVS